MGLPNKVTRPVSITLEEEPYKAIRGVLFQHGVSFQEFVGYVAGLGMMKDPRVLELIRESRSTTTVPHITTRTTAREIYNLLEQNSPFNRKGTRDDHTQKSEDGIQGSDKESWGREFDLDPQ